MQCCTVHFVIKSVDSVVLIKVLFMCAYTYMFTVFQQAYLWPLKQL